MIFTSKNIPLRKLYIHPLCVLCAFVVNNIFTYLKPTVILLVFVAGPLLAQQADTIRINELMVLRLPQAYHEAPVTKNPIENDAIAHSFDMPSQGDAVSFGEAGKAQWKKISPNEKGWFSDSALFGGYAACVVEMKQAGVLMLEAMGHDYVYVNNVPRPGNPYQDKDEWETWESKFNYYQLPVQLQKGQNVLLFRVSRNGIFKARLRAPEHPVFISLRDATMPDFVIGQPADTWCSFLVVNTTDKPLRNYLMRSLIPYHGDMITQMPLLPPMSVRKVHVRLKLTQYNVKEKSFAKFTLLDDKHSLVDTAMYPMSIVGAGDTRRETFVSSIDGSVQYYAINPSSTDSPDKPQALFLSLHGASVEARNQAASYYPKTWGHIVAPTNRRPYGYNWEDWGRIDAMEVMNIAKKKYNIDPNRVYLTGHSMGGHGVWQIGAMYPDQFGAIAPSAGWISFWTYRDRSPDKDTTTLLRMLRRSTSTSETFRFADNYKQFGVYVLHGADDDNVQVEQPRMMLDTLRNRVHDVEYFEQPKAGHWWDNNDEAGADCVDWPPIFDFFARHARPEKERIRIVNYITSNPGVSAKNNWVTIDQQIEQLKPSSVNIRFDPEKKRYVGVTENVYRLGLDVDIMQEPRKFSIKIDSQKIENIVAGKFTQLWLEKKNGTWTLAANSVAEQKGAHRYGTFKDAFRSLMMFVYGTKGTKEENAWAYEKARYDAEKFWYQGNGSVDVVADVDFQLHDNPDRSVILYGNEKTNAVWKNAFKDSPVTVRKDVVDFGGKEIKGGNLCCFFVRPRAGSNSASIAAVSGTGIEGMRLTQRIPYMNPGFGLPDVTVMSSDILEHGEAGIKLLGFFGNDWSIGTGEFLIKN